MLIREACGAVFLT